jgi:hypothetical protein
MPLLEFSLEVRDGQLAEIDRVKAILSPEISRNEFWLSA